LAGFRIAGGKTAGKAPLLAEQIRLDPIGQGVEAEVGDPEHAAMDRKYGSRETRAKLESHGIRASLRPLGRPPRQKDRWFKRKQKERNRIEGTLGVERQRSSSGRVRYRVKDGSEIWIRSGILAMNLKTALAKS
jgi:IS5 family transposase